MNIIQAIKDKNLFCPFLGDSVGRLSSLANWMIALRVLYGLPVLPKRAELIKVCTGRDLNLLPKDGFDTALFLTGRRSGKSRIAAVIAAFEAALSGREKLLSKGETGLVAIIAPTKKQGRIVRNYLRAIFDETPLLQNEIMNETQEGFLLRNGVLIEILVGDWRSVRGYTLLAAVIDEVCFFGLDAESKVRSDTELIRAIQPSLATTNGRLICISSPYAKKGWAFSQYKRNFGNDNGKTLIWNCPSRTMNPALSQSIVDEAMAEDLQSAKSEYLGEFRDDISVFLPREVIESCIVQRRKELLPKREFRYKAFCDLSGGRSDCATLAISHKQDNKVILDKAVEYAPPFVPTLVIENMCEKLREYNIRQVYGDNYAGEFVTASFQRFGIKYERAEKSKSQIYLEVIPIICSKAVELLDNETMVTQFSNLQRRTRSGGMDSVDHLAGCKDDIANAVAGAVVFAGKKERLTVGVF